MLLMGMQDGRTPTEGDCLISIWSAMQLPFDPVTLFLAHLTDLCLHKCVKASVQWY